MPKPQLKTSSNPDLTALPASNSNLLHAEISSLQEQNKNYQHEILKLKENLSFYKNESFEFTQNLQKQNQVFIDWQQQLQTELKFLVGLLTRSQNNKYETWKKKSRERSVISQPVEIEEEVESETRNIRSSLSNLTCFSSGSYPKQSSSTWSLLSKNENINPSSPCSSEISRNSTPTGRSSNPLRRS